MKSAAEVGKMAGGEAATRFFFASLILAFLRFICRSVQTRMKG